MASSLRVSPHQNVWRIPSKKNCVIYSTWLRLAPFLPRWGPSRVISILPNQTVTYQWNNHEKTNNIVRLKQTFQSNRSDPFAFRPKFWLLLSKEGFFWKWNGKLRSDWTDQSKPSTTPGGEPLWPENFHTERIVPFINFSTKISATFLLLGTEIREFFCYSGILNPGLWNPEFSSRNFVRMESIPRFSFMPSFISAVSLCRYIPLFLQMQLIKSFRNVRLTTMAYSSCACWRWSNKITAFVILLLLFKANRFSLFLVFQSNYEAGMQLHQ